MEALSLARFLDGSIKWVYVCVYIYIYISKLLFLRPFKGFKTWRLKILGPNYENIKLWNWGCACNPKGAYAKLDFKYINDPTSNCYNLLILNPNWATFVFKLKPKMSNFKFKKPHSNCLCSSKVMVKTMSKCHFLVSLSKQFEYFWVVITSEWLRIL